jgi:hypothetical protein
MSADFELSWDERPKAGWEEFQAARARFQERLRAQTEIARLELLFSLELELGNGPGEESANADR